MTDNQDNNLEVLVNNRDAIMLAEVGAWLHNYDKCTDEHLQGHTSDGSRSGADPTQYLSLLGTHTIRLLGEEVTLEEVTLTELLKEEHKSSPDLMTDTSKKWLIRALGFCHSAAHTEKEEKLYYRSQQTLTDLRSSSPFGYDSPPLITTSTPSLTDQLKSLLDQLKSLLPDLPSSRSDCRQCIANIFGYALADTRRPLNEVTLWDWSSMVAALYKSAIAQALLDGPVEPPVFLRWRLLGVRIDGSAFSENVTRIPDLKARQELLTNGLDKVRTLLEERYPLGTEVYRDTNGSMFIVPDIPCLLDLENVQREKLSDLIRKEFSAGTVKEDASLKLGDEVVPSIEFDPSKKNAWFWYDPASHHAPLPIVDHITQRPASAAKPSTVRTWWQNYSEDICTVCQLRPQGWGAADNKAHYNRRARGVKCPSKPICQTCKILERKVCAICEERREDRSERWAGDLKTTIWIDEVADANGKLALIVGKFGLEPWLDGTMIFYPAGHENRKIPAQLALKIRNMGASLTEGPVLKIQGNDYIWNDSLGVFKSRAEVREEQVPRFKDDRLHIDTTNEDVQVTDVQRLQQGTYRVAVTKLPPDLIAGSTLRIQGQDFYAVGDGKHVETASNRAAKVIEGKTLYPGYLMVEQAIGLYKMEEAQTPARLYRVWETTLQFWQNLQDELDLGKVSPRLRIQIALPETELRDKLARFHTYELKLRKINLSVTKVAEQEFITVDNLQRVAILLNPSKAKEYCEDYEKAAEYVSEQLQEQCRANKPIEVEEPTGYGSPNKLLGKLDIMSVNRDNIPYIPAISILTEPRTFMVIVPADKALQVMQAIKGKYEKEMGKVRSRLPLITGIVFAGARTPLSAILDAGRRILNQPALYERRKIKRFEKIIESPNRGPWPSKVDFMLDEHILPMKVQTVMGDGTTPDEWYPYWHMEAPIPNRWVLASDLGEGNTVSFTPSHFDFELLDTAARRFEISYDANGKRRGRSHPARPYYLEQLDEIEMLWNTLFEDLETTQIDNLVGIIEEKRIEWLADHNDEVFKQTVHDALNNANWRPLKRPKPESETFEQLYRAALSGQLADAVELYIRILKPRPEADESQTKNMTGVTL